MGAIIAYIILGIILLVISYQLLVKKNINIINNKRRRNVKKKDIQDYIKGIGNGLAFMGSFFLVGGISSFLSSVFVSSTMFLIGIIGGIIILIKTQIKYNGSIF